MKIKIILLYILTLTLLTMPAQAQELDSSGTQLPNDDWGGYIQRYNQGYDAKQVTPAEYENAVKTLQKYGKIKKDPVLEQQKKKWWWPFAGGKKQPETMNIDQVKINEILKKEKEYFKKEIPSAPNPLLRLPVALFYNKILIPDGYYLIEAVEKEDRHFIKLKQGIKTIVELEALPVPVSVSKPNLAEVSFVDSSTVKISYQNNTFKIESFVDIFEESMLLEED